MQNRLKGGIFADCTDFFQRMTIRGSERGGMVLSETRSKNGMVRHDVMGFIISSILYGSRICVARE
jgi:hypothetical protein